MKLHPLPNRPPGGARDRPEDWTPRDRGRPLPLALCLVVLLLTGCGPRRPPPREEPKQQPLSKAPSLALSESVIRVADPQRRWKFEARSAQVKAAGVNGPYTLSPAECRYQQAGKPPVLMRAKRAEVEKLAKRVTLIGSVRVESNGWLLEADRVEYDLNTAKVVAPGQTKLSFQPAQPAPR